ncbi:phosphotransferase [Sulfoacidibacillus thermotolerans]|uniref:Aminoglycoside phosphotransferase domain-containing protein n=1 Tax=Sulfoacidibacillus thermotolerans TaxID=1765684 RepID=A0A2U3DB60_SULT2|nr:phosphotransferase [Sulfoacidibacillus thermotolerans]PWI58513.1 hypothetical protein BM613_03045 [Sulfoacidibacillus thermotolerans]
METWMTGTAVQDIERAYGVKIWATIPLRSVVAVVTDRGRFMCKRYGAKQGLSFERIKAIIHVKDQLAQYGLCKTYLRTIDDRGFCELDGDLLTLEPWLSGEHADFSIRADRLSAIQAVARLHHAQITVPKPLVVTQSIVQKFSLRLRRAVDVVHSGGLVGMSEKEWERYRHRAEQILRDLPHQELQWLTEKNRDAGVLCHRDLAPHNILVQPGAPAVLIDFDLAGPDSPLYDLHQIFDHMVYRTGTQSWLDETLASYLQIHPLTLREQHLLRRLLEFPTPLLREVGDLQDARSAHAKKRAALRIRYVNHLMQERLQGYT